MEKVLIDQLIIEVTRKCNMTCDHCLRGDAENLNININSIENLFKQVSAVNNITFTGGEPFLNINAIAKTLELAKKYNVNIYQFYIVTNGTKANDKIMKTLLDWHMYCVDNNGGYIDDEMNSISISNDQFHDGADKKAINKLMAFRFTAMRNEKDGQAYSRQSIINQGKAQENGIGYRETNFYPYQIEDNEITETLIYLNANGDLIPDCDLSYESQEDHKFANVNEPSFNLIGSVISYNDYLNKQELKVA